MGYAYLGYTVGAFILTLITLSPFVIKMINNRIKNKELNYEEN